MRLVPVSETYRFPDESTAAPFGVLNPVATTVLCAPRNVICAFADGAAEHSTANPITRTNLRLRIPEMILLANDGMANVTEFPHA